MIDSDVFNHCYALFHVLPSTFHRISIRLRNGSWPTASVKCCMEVFTSEELPFTYASSFRDAEGRAPIHVGTPHACRVHHKGMPQYHELFFQVVIIYLIITWPHCKNCFKKKCMSVWLYKKFAPNNHKTKPVTVNWRSQQEFSEMWFHGLWSWIAKGNRKKKCKFKTFGGLLFLLVGWTFCYFSSLSNGSLDDCVGDTFRMSCVGEKPACHLSLYGARPARNHSLSPHLL